MVVIWGPTLRFAYNRGPFMNFGSSHLGQPHIVGDLSVPPCTPHNGPSEVESFSPAFAGHGGLVVAFCCAPVSLSLLVSWAPQMARRFWVAV